MSGLRRMLAVLLPLSLLALAAGVAIVSVSMSPLELWVVVRANGSQRIILELADLTSHDGGAGLLEALVRGGGASLMRPVPGPGRAGRPGAQCHGGSGRRAPRWR